MNCKDIDNLLTAYLEGEVTPEEEQQVKKHLAGCSQCRSELELISTSRDKLSSVLKLEASRAEPPPSSWERIAKKAGSKERAEKPAAKRFAGAWLTVPISILLLVFLVVGSMGLLGGMAPSPLEPPALVSDGEGGAIVVWKGSPYYSSGDIYAQYVDADGNLLWGENGIQVFDCESDCEAYISEATNDDDGGVIIYWKYKIYKGEDIGYAQHISRDGELLWGDGGIPVEEVPEEFVLILPDSSWELRYDIVAVSVSGKSVVIYEEPSFKTLGYSRVIDDGSGGVIVTSRVGDSDSISKAYSVYVQRIDAEGNRLWGESGLEIQYTAPSPVLLIIAAVVLLVSILSLIGMYRGNRQAMILVAIIPVIVGIAALFSSIKVIIIAGVVLMTVLALVGVFRRSQLLLVSGAIMPSIIGITAMFTLLVDLLGYSYHWAYVIDTPLNQLAIAIVPVAGFIIGAVNVRKKLVTKWVTVPVFIFTFLVTVLIALILSAPVG